MDYTANYDADYSSEQFPEVPRSRRWKKRRKPPRKHRKPSRPITYMGQRSNNRKTRL